MFQRCVHTKGFLGKESATYMLPPLPPSLALFWQWGFGVRRFIAWGSFPEVSGHALPARPVQAGTQDDSIKTCHPIAIE